MKSKITILLLLVCLIGFGQSVPNTNTFTLQDVSNVLEGETTLQGCFDVSVDAYFDFNYKGAKNSLANFRNYNVPKVPSVVTYAATNVTSNSITVSGNVITDNGFPVTQRGIIRSGSSGDVYVEADTQGTGVFAVTLTGLTENTTYTYRAIAHSSQGTASGSTLSASTIVAPVSTPLPSLGDSYEGGIVFYIEDLSDKKVVYVMSNRLGTSERKWRTARDEARNLTEGGFNDWFLPSITEAAKVREFLQSYTPPSRPPNTNVYRELTYWCSENYYYNFIPPQTYAATLYFNDQSSYTYRAVQQTYYAFAVRHKYIYK